MVLDTDDKLFRENLIKSLLLISRKLEGVTAELAEIKQSLNQEKN